MTMVKSGLFINERYEIIALIGSGGTADVYKAKDHRLNRFVAIKILKQNYTGDHKIVAKFRQEAQACAGLTHPNIVSVFDVGNDGELYYIVMELIEGITLKKFIEKKGKLEVKEAIGIAIQIAQGLDAAHAAHIVHRDIKPQNIIISKEGKVKVTDFGIARATFKTSTNTINQAPVGSVHYLSPEQARGGFSDERSDIYSLGITIYEMLAGRVPYLGESNVSVALLHIQAEAEPMVTYNEAVTPAIEKIVAKCMQKKPERRYFSAAELIKDLKASIANPSGDFVTMSTMTPNDAPTINMTQEELSEIKNQSNASHLDEMVDDDYYDEDEEEEDEEEFDSVNSKTEKIIVIASIVLVALFLGVIIYFVASRFNTGSGPDNRPTNSDDISKLSNADITKLMEKDYTIDELKKVLREEYKITSFSSKYSESDTVEKDHIINMSYEANLLIVEVSTGKEQIRMVTMINVVGLTADVAKEKLKSQVSQDLRIEIVESDSNSPEPYTTVLSQSSQEGDIVPYNFTITLVYSKGPLVLQVPDLSKYTKSMVETQYGDSFTLKFEYDVENDYSTTQADKVVRTSPETNTPIAKGEELIVYLSSQTVIMPNVTGMTLEAAKPLLEGKSLTVNVEEEYSADIAAGTVISQKDAVETLINRGGSVTIVVSKGVEPTPEATATPTPTPSPVPEEKPTVTEAPTVDPSEPTPEITPEVDPDHGTPIE